MVQGHGFDAPLGSLPHRRSHTGDWGSVSLGSVPTLSTQQGTPEGAMGGARGRGILGPEPQDSHRKRTAAVGTASAGPGRNGRLSMPQVRSTLRSPTDSRGDSLPDTSMHLSHAHPPQRHSDLGTRRDPRGQQREHGQERGVPVGTERKPRYQPRACADPGSVAPGLPPRAWSPSLWVADLPCLLKPTSWTASWERARSSLTPRDHILDRTGDPVPRTGE